jgi:hypothetical protein
VTDRIRPRREMWLAPRRRLRLLRRRWGWRRLWQLHNRCHTSQLPQRLLLRRHHPQLRHPQRLPWELRNPRPGPRRPPGTVSQNEVSADKSNRRKVSQDPVKRAGAGHIDMNDVRVKIHKMLFSMVSGRSWMVRQALEWFWVGHEWFWARARFPPCRDRANKNAGLSPEERFSFYLAAEIE